MLKQFMLVATMLLATSMNTNCSWKGNGYFQNNSNNNNFYKAPTYKPNPLRQQQDAQLHKNNIQEVLDATDEAFEIVDGVKFYKDTPEGRAAKEAEDKENLQKAIADSFERHRKMGEHQNAMQAYQTQATAAVLQMRAQAQQEAALIQHQARVAEQHELRIEQTLKEVYDKTGKPISQREAEVVLKITDIQKKNDLTYQEASAIYHSETSGGSCIVQ